MTGVIASRTEVTAIMTVIGRIVTGVRLVVLVPRLRAARSAPGLHPRPEGTMMIGGVLGMTTTGVVMTEGARSVTVVTTKGPEGPMAMPVGLVKALADIGMAFGDE